MTKKPKVLVVVVYNAGKQYCQSLYPIVTGNLHYSEKEILEVTELQEPKVGTAATGEEAAAAGRNYGMHYARKHKFDFMFQMDIDIVPPVDIIQRLLATGSFFVGAAVAARGNENQCIGHIYRNRDLLSREPLYRPPDDDVLAVDGIAGAALLIGREVFGKVDLADYKGPDHIEGRHTADDEYYQIKVYNELGVVPECDYGLRPWHYDADGYAYRLWGHREYWGDLNEQARIEKLMAEVK